MWNDVPAHVKWRTGSCEMTYRAMSHDAPAHVKWRTGSCNMTYRIMWYDVPGHVIWRTGSCDMTYPRHVIGADISKKWNQSSSSCVLLIGVWLKSGWNTAHFSICVKTPDIKHMCWAPDILSYLINTGQFNHIWAKNFPAYIWNNTNLRQNHAF